MKCNSKYIIAFLFALIANFTLLWAQVSIKAFVDKDKILIGEPISLTVEAYTPLGVSVVWFDAASLAPFEIIQQLPADTLQNIDGKQTLQKFIITAFDSGQLVIPPLEVKVDGVSYFSDSLVIRSSFISFDPQEDYRDIKDIIEARDEENNWWIWISLLSLIVLSVLAYWLLANKKRPVVVSDSVISKPSAYAEAMKSLSELKEKAPSLGEKTYYTMMNNILRKYLEGKFNISTFDRTNEELIKALSKFNIPAVAYQKLVYSMNIADYVKFAKFRPSEEDNREHLEVVGQSITILDNSVKSVV